MFLCQGLPQGYYDKETLESNMPIIAGKFLVPEYNRYLGLAIDDLKRLKPLFDAMDDKHSYEKIILYREQRFHSNWRAKTRGAYEEYKSKRA